MYQTLLFLHSSLRWLVLILLLLAILNAAGSLSKNQYLAKDKKLNLFAMIFIHVQILLGFILYFQSGKVSFHQGWMKEQMFRFFGMEHVLLMVIAMIVITIGRKKAEKIKDAHQKHKKIILFYTLTLLLILAAIPWPFREALGGSWF